MNSVKWKWSLTCIVILLFVIQLFETFTINVKKNVDIFPYSFTEIHVIDFFLCNKIGCNFIFIAVLTKERK